MKDTKSMQLASDSIKEIRTFLDKTKFKETKALLNILDNCKTVEDFEKVRATANAMREDGKIPDLECCGFEVLIDKIINSESFKSGVYTGNDLISIFKERILTTTDIGKVIQFRNCITDMLMLDFIQLGEYIELSNEVDKYIQYTLTNGGMK